MGKLNTSLPHFAAAFLIAAHFVRADQMAMLTNFGLPKSSASAEFVNVNGILFFVAGIERSLVRRRELWRSDGTTAGTFRIKTGLPSNLIPVNGTLFFVSDDDAHGNELWKSDGTEAGTVLVKDINPGSGGSDPSNLINVNGALFFTSNGGFWYEPSVQGLWKSDGTDAGTVRVKDLAAPELVNVNGTLFFFSDGVNGPELWKSDGTEAGTVLMSVLFGVFGAGFASVLSPRSP